MATIVKQKNGKYFAKICKSGISKIATFKTNTEAQQWVTTIEETIFSEKYNGVINITLPPTSINNYFTGITALNIPDEDASTGDWHIKATFTPKKMG